MGGLGCSLSPSRIVPSAHAGKHFQNEGMGGWMGETSPGSPEQGQEAGAHEAPLSLFPGVVRLCSALRCWGSASLLTGVWAGIKLPFHRVPELWGSRGWEGLGACSGLPRCPPAASPQTMATLCWGFMCLAPFPGAQLVTFYHLHIHMGIQRA